MIKGNHLHEYGKHAQTAFFSFYFNRNITVYLFEIEIFLFLFHLDQFIFINIFDCNGVATVCLERLFALCEGIVAFCLIILCPKWTTLYRINVVKCVCVHWIETYVWDRKAYLICIISLLIFTWKKKHTQPSCSRILTTS